MQYVTICAAIAALCFSAGPVFSQSPASVNDCVIPGAHVTFPPNNHADTPQGLIATSFFSNEAIKGCIAVTDLQGNPAWSFCGGTNMLMTRPVAGGTFLVITNTTSTDYTLSEIDLAGKVVHVLRESSANAQLAALGKQPIIDFDHEAIRLPNGYTAVLAHNERLETDVQGPGTVDVMGDEVLVLDTNWRIVWTWNAFDFLPVRRAAVLGEICKPCNQFAKGCCPITLAPKANDWIHANSMAYDPTDGNLLLSLRSQDWVIKISYHDGAGDGHIVWTLGNQGNITMLNSPHIASPWFSHQHTVELVANQSPKLLLLFDNGNTRHATDPNATSRGQVLMLDERAMTVDIKTNVNFPYYSFAYGTAQLLDNGNYWWQAGVVGGHNAPDPTRATEYVPSGSTGTPAYGIQFADTAYRSFRLTSLTGF